MHIPRRTVLRRAAALAAGTALTSQLLPNAAHAEPKAPVPPQAREAIRRAEAGRARVATGLPSHNGWEMEKVVDDHGSIYTRPVPGTPLDGVAVRMGDVETVLVHLVRRFHYEIDELRRGDVVGWRSPTTVRKGLPESNLASGTAVHIRPGHYPAGTRDGFFPLQLTVIRDILAELDGVVRWGGDDRKVDEALFYIDVKPGDARLAAVVDKIRDWQDVAGRGAGTPVDVSSRTRRSAAQLMERRQRSSA
ncbi:hypothetical protein AB0K19_23600 [Streptomyces klenkii]